MAPRGKALEDYTDAKKATLLANNKAINGLIRALDDDEINHISSCKMAFEAWEALRIAYEGDDVVKEQQIQAYQSRFEDLRMSKSESFNEFYLRLSTLVN